VSAPRAVAAGSWLLSRAGVDVALAGDLEERIAAGASIVWYWRQVALSILAAWIGTIRTHKWLAVRAVITGWAFWALLFLARQSIGGSLTFGRWTETLVGLIRYGNWIVIGWGVGALHRPYQGAMVLAYIAFLIVMSLPGVSQAVSMIGHPSYHAPSAPMVLFAIVSLTVGALLSDRPAGRPWR
jgi:hypothetical protein